MFHTIGAVRSEVDSRRPAQVRAVYEARHSLCAPLLWLIVLTLPSLAFGGEIRFGGQVSTAIQVGLTGCASPGDCRFLNFRNANVLSLNVEANPSETTELFADVSIRNTNFTRVDTLDETGSVSEVQPVDIRLNQARMDLYDLFGLSGLDLRAGAIRIAWGTGDGVNPTDRLNPYDLEEGTGFDKRLASLATQLTWSGADVGVELVVLPLFLPAILPVERIDFTTLGAPSDVLDLTQGDSDPPDIRKVETPVSVPEPALENIQVGARIRYGSPIGDFSLMFYRGFDSLPQASGQVRLTGFQTANRVDLGVPLAYPRVMMVGADYRGPLVDTLSAWAEVAVLFPEEHVLSAARNQLEQLVKLGRLDEVPDPLPVQTTQSAEVFVKAVAGLEYLVGDGFYINAQYARGLASERQATDVHDYVLLALRGSLLDGRLILGARGGLEIASSDTLGFQAGASISWLHGDAARLTWSATFLGGASGTTFQRFERLSSTKLSFALSF